MFRELREELSGKTKDLAENGEPVFVEAQRSQVTCPFYSAAEQHSMCLNPGSIWLPVHILLDLVSWMHLLIFSKFSIQPFG